MAEGACGVEGHPDWCNCDVDLDAHGRVPGDWGRFLEGALARVRVDPVDNPVKYWDYTYALLEARLAARRRARLGLNGYDHQAYADKRRIIEAYLREGRSIVPLVGNDIACHVNLGPELPWFEVVATLTVHDTTGDSPLWRWNAKEWRFLEDNLFGPMSMRRLGTELGVTHTTIARLRRWYRPPD